MKLTGTTLLTFLCPFFSCDAMVKPLFLLLLFKGGKLDDITVIIGRVESA